MHEECVREISTSDIHALQQFITLEHSLMAGYPLFVSNFDESIFRYLSGKSVMTQDYETSLFIALDGDKDVARCAALINPKYQEARHERVGFIGYFAAALGYDLEVRAMLERAEDWLKGRGVKRVIAPYNGSALMPGLGFLTAAYDEEPVMFAGWNPPYYPLYLTHSGYQPTYPMFVYTIDYASPKYQSALERAKANRAFQVRPINKKQWSSELDIFRQIINENFTDEWEYYPATQLEFLEFLDQIKLVVDPQQMLIAEVGGKPAGVCIGFPNWNQLARGCQGKFGLWEKIKFLLLNSHYETAGLVFAAVNSECRGMSIGPALEVLVTRRYQELGVKKVYGYIVNESNYRSRKAIESIGGSGDIWYTAFDKQLLW